jgi:hypothetical protein
MLNFADFSSDQCERMICYRHFHDLDAEIIPQDQLCNDLDAEITLTTSFVTTQDAEIALKKSFEREFGDFAALSVVAETPL